VAGDDAGAFLPAMLERVKAVVGQFGGIRMTENAEHAAVMFGVILLSLHRARRRIVAKENRGRNCNRLWRGVAAGIF
jgi:hypothetical protein